MKAQKTICTVLTVLLLMASLSTTAFAAEPVSKAEAPISITPRWEIAYGVDVFLYVGGGIAEADLVYSVPSGTTVTSKKVVISRSTSSSGPWTQMSSGSLYTSCSTTSGYWYKAVGTVSLKNSSGKTESISITAGPFKA